MNEFGEKILQSIDMDANVMEHHGIKGQRWGVRRTPEQLGHGNIYKKYSKNKLNKILNDPTKLYKNRYKFTLKEKEKALENFKMNTKILKAINDEKIEKNRIKNEIKREKQLRKEETKKEEKRYREEEKNKLKMQKIKDKDQLIKEKELQKQQIKQKIKQGRILSDKIKESGKIMHNTRVLAKEGQEMAIELGFPVDKTKKSLISDLVKKKNKR